MRQAMHRPFNRTQVISFGFLTVLLSLLQPIPPVSAEQHSMKFVEKKDVQTLTRTPHRLIRKQPNAPIASVEPSPSGSLPISSVPTAPPLPQTDNTTPQSTESSSLYRSVGAAVPIATISVAPPPATTKGSIAIGTSATGTIPLAAPGNGKGNSSTSGNGNTGGRSMSKLAAEMPGLAQLISAPSDPVVSTNPAIGASPASLSFTAQTGTNPAAQTLSISNTGAGTLTWMASSNAAWLTLSPASGSGNGAVTLSVATGTMTPGTYSSAVTLTATGANSVTIPASFTVTAPPAIGASPATLSFTATQGGANPAPQTLSISNTGGGTLNWTANETTPWLTLSTTGGTGNGSITLTATTGSLSVGTTSGTVILSGGTGATPVTIPITFTIAAAPNITLNPSSLTYTATQGAANPTNQTVSLTTSGGTFNWTVNDDVTWLTVSPASGSSSSTLTVSVNTAGLTAATQTGTITVSGTGASSKTIAVTLTVNAPMTSSATLTWNPNTDTDLAGYKIYRASQSGAYGAALATVPVGTMSYQATGLSANTTYFFVITAYDNAGNESPFSNEVSKSIF